MENSLDADKVLVAFIFIRATAGEAGLNFMIAPPSIVATNATGERGRKS